MAKLTDKDDNVLTDSNDILQEVKSFYLKKKKKKKKLYERRDVEDCQIFQMLTEVPHLSDEEAERTEGEITLNEASIALNIPRTLVQMGLMQNFSNLFGAK